VLRLAPVARCRAGHPSGTLCSAAARRRVSSDHASAAEIHLCRSGPSAGRDGPALGVVMEIHGCNIVADRKRSRTGVTVAIRGRHHTRVLSSPPDMPRPSAPLLRRAAAKESEPLPLFGRGCEVTAETGRSVDADRAGYLRFPFEVSDHGLAVEGSRVADELKRPNQLLDTAVASKGKQQSLTMDRMAAAVVGRKHAVDGAAARGPGIPRAATPATPG
jgi:hypothetical protein